MTCLRWCVIGLGNFSSPKVDEFVISRGNIIELWRPDEAGNINIICSYEVYGLIRALKPFRLSGILHQTDVRHRKRHGLHSHRLRQRQNRGAAVQEREQLVREDPPRNVRKGGRHSRFARTVPGCGSHGPRFHDQLNLPVLLTRRRV